MMNSLLKTFQLLKSDPISVLSQRFNLPKDLKNPNDIIQHLLNTGQVSQEQVNQAMQLRNNPVIQQIFNLR